MTTPRESGSAEDTQIRSAARFFWLWLVVATSASIAGNVTHAILSAPRGSETMAAVVPPAVLLGFTNSMALLVRGRRVGGLLHWCASAMTITLAACALVLSVDILTNLATALRMRSDSAWLWPYAIDVSIGQWTLALLSLRMHAPSDVPSSARVETLGSPADPVGQAAGGPVDADAPSVGSSDRKTVCDWMLTADQLVRAGVTQKDPAVVAEILAAHAVGTPPPTIGKRLDVHHSTVKRVAQAGELAR